MTASPGERKDALGWRGSVKNYADRGEKSLLRLSRSKYDSTSGRSAAIGLPVRDNVFDRIVSCGRNREGRGRRECVAGSSGRRRARRLACAAEPAGLACSPAVRQGPGGWWKARRCSRGSTGMQLAQKGWSCRRCRPSLQPCAQRGCNGALHCGGNMRAGLHRRRRAGLPQPDPGRRTK